MGAYLWLLNAYTKPKKIINYKNHAEIIFLIIDQNLFLFWLIRPQIGTYLKTNTCHSSTCFDQITTSGTVMVTSGSIWDIY